MPLPVGGPRVQWPPVPSRPALTIMAEHDAWYSGDPNRIAAFYDVATSGQSDLGDSAEWWRFYRRAGNMTGQRSRAVLHVPLAGDIAGVSAAMLFGEEPAITIPEAHDEQTENKAAKQTEERLLAILEESGFYGKLVEAGEQCAALGGVFLKIAWDEQVAGYPFIEPVQPDGALPEWKFGRLTAVTFWRIIARNGERVTRWLERYEPGVILHGLYLGSRDLLGDRIPLFESEITRDVRDVIALPDADMLAARYIPNMRPNRRDRGSQLGQSDFAGCEGLFDALDETYTSWVRDVRLAKARLLVPRDYLSAVANTDGTTSVSFDADREVFSPLNIEPGDEHTTITLAQFAIRAVEHEATAMSLIERAVTAAGYSPQTFGLHIEGRAESGTALRIREKRTLITHNRKAMLAQQPIADMLAMLLVVDRELFGDDLVDPRFRPRVAIRDGLPDDPLETINAVSLLATAGAASLETLVKMQHPDWDQPDIEAEVKRIRDQQGMNVPDPATLGDPNANGGAAGA